MTEPGQGGRPADDQSKIRRDAVRPGCRQKQPQERLRVSGTSTDESRSVVGGPARVHTMVAKSRARVTDKRSPRVKRGRCAQRECDRTWGAEVCCNVDQRCLKGGHWHRVVMAGGRAMNERRGDRSECCVTNGVTLDVTKR